MNYYICRKKSNLLGKTTNNFHDREFIEMLPIKLITLPNLICSFFVCYCRARKSIFCLNLFMPTF